MLYRNQYWGLTNQFIVQLYTISSLYIHYIVSWIERALIFMEHSGLYCLHGQLLNDVNLDQTIKDLKNSSSLPHEESVERLYGKIVSNMQLTTESCLLSLIFIERLIKESGVQILNFNWKPIVFGSLVLAAKFWEDILYWNIDFVDPLAMYTLNSINQLEATFLGLCQYKLYVSKELYDRYYETIIRKTSEIALLEYESIEQFDANDQNIQIMQ